MSDKIVVQPGDQFGDWTVIEELARHQTPSGQQKRIVSCICKCGNVAPVQLYKLISPLRSLKCKDCASKKGNVKHGLYYHPLYKLYHGILKRCLNPRDVGYKNYGGRGIKVCNRWMGKDGFVNFLADMGERPSSKHSIERNNNDGDYSPSNCRWATRREQNNNTRSNRFLTYRGKTQTLACWARETGVPYKALQHRLARGWTVERMLTTPIRQW